MTVPTDVPFVDEVTVVEPEWANGINDWVYTAYSTGVIGVTGGVNITLPATSLTLASLTGTETLTNKTLTTPVLGVATATSINKVAITAPATSSTLTIADGKTLTASNTVTLTATDGSTLAIGTGGTLGTAAYTAATAYLASSFTLAELNTAVSDGNVAEAGANNSITSLSGLTTDLSVAQGGTGASTHTSHGVLIGAGTSAIASTAAGTAGHVLTSNGAAADPTFQAATGAAAPYVVAKAIVANTTVSNAHSLGAIPSSFQVTLRCITTENGYAAGDEVGGINDDGVRRGNLTGFVNATTIGASIAANLYVQNRAATIGTLVIITPAKWEVVLRAWL